MEKLKANARIIPFYRDSQHLWKDSICHFYERQVLSGHIIRQLRKSEILYKTLVVHSVHQLEKRHMQCFQAITSLSITRLVKCLWNMSFYGHGIWSPYTKQALQLSSPKANCVLCYCVCMCVYVQLWVLGVMRAGGGLGECSSPWNAVIYWTTKKFASFDSLKHLRYAGKAS